MNDIRVTVTGAGSLFGQGIIKCLRRADLPMRLHGLDYFATAMGFHWCDETGLLPDLLDPAISEEAWFADLCRQVGEAGSQILFVGADFELRPLARLAETLRARTGCHAVVGPTAIVDICKDKYRTARWLREIGAPAPESRLPSDGIDEIETAIAYPMIVKPRFGARSRGVVRVADRAALQRALAVCKDPVVQRYLPGAEREYSCGVVVLDGRVDTVSVLRRRLKDGNTSTAVADPVPAVDALCRKVGKALAPHGPINIQLRLVDETPYVFEINPRFSGTTIFRALLGVNEPERVLRHVLTLPLSPPPILRAGRVTRYFDEIVEDDTAMLSSPPTTMVTP